MKSINKHTKTKGSKLLNNSKSLRQILLLFLLCLLLYFAEAYQYVYYVVQGSRAAAILFLAAYHIIAFMYGHLFFNDARTALLFVAVTALLILMGDYSRYAPSAMLLHGLTSIKNSIMTILVLLIVYVLIRMIIRISSKRNIRNKERE